MTHTLKPIGRLWAVLLLLAVAVALPWQRAEAAHDIRGINGPDLQPLFVPPLHQPAGRLQPLYVGLR